MGVYLGQSIYNDSQVTQEWVEEEIAKNGKGVFFATHGQTTFQSILQEYNNGKIIVCKYELETPGETTTYYLNLVRFNTETFDFVGVMRDGTIYRTGINANEGWENVTTYKLDKIEFVEYNVDSYSTIKSYYDYGKFVVLKYQQQTPLVTKYYFYPLVSVDETNKEIVFGSLQLGQNNKKITFTVTDSTGWAAPVESAAVVVDATLDQTSHNPVENMAIAVELADINNKITGDLNDIFLALASKGVTVPAGAGLDDVAGLIEDIPAGGGAEIDGFEICECAYIDNPSLGLNNPVILTLSKTFDNFTSVIKTKCSFETPVILQSTNWWTSFGNDNNGPKTGLYDYDNHEGNSLIVQNNGWIEPMVRERDYLVYGNVYELQLYQDQYTINAQNGTRTNTMQAGTANQYTISRAYPLGWLRHDGIAYKTHKRKFYYQEARDYTTNELLCRLIPVRRISDEHKGFYEIVTGTFYDVTDSNFKVE